MTTEKRIIIGICLVVCALIAASFHWAAGLLILLLAVAVFLGVLG